MCIPAGSPTFVVQKRNMTQQDRTDYERIAQAITYIKSHFKEQPDLDAVAAQVNLSPFHFQRMFTEWAGVSPKKFLRYISVEYAKHMLRDKQTTLFDAAFETGLSGTGRLHDLFVTIEGMTPGEFKNGGTCLTINYNRFESPFGDVLIASTPKGICYMAFTEAENSALHQLIRHFPHASFVQATDPLQEQAMQVFTSNRLTDPVRLHLKGSDFQLKVWEALLKIPEGELSTYKHIAADINRPAAARAVGTAVGSNPVAYLIPCHRVIQSTGLIGGYMWGTERKTAIIGWEAARREKSNHG